MNRVRLLSMEEWTAWEAEQRAHQVAPSSAETALSQWLEQFEENNHHLPGANGHGGPNGNGNDHGDWKLRPVYRLAEQHCANWCKGGTCEGLMFDETGRGIRKWTAGGRCLLLLSQRCPYFEEAVLPMEKRKEEDWKPFALGKAFREAARLYHETFPETVVVEPTTRKCPDCGKRRIEPRKRCCGECRNRRRKATNAANQRNWQKKRVHPNTVKQNGSSPRAASQGTVSDTRCHDPAEPILAH